MIGGGAFAGPVPHGQEDAIADAGRFARVLAGWPVVEQAEGDADAAGDGCDGVVRRFRHDLVEDGAGLFAVTGVERLNRLPQDGDGKVAGAADRGEAGHVQSFDGPVHRGLQCGEVGHVDVLHVDALFGEHRGELV